VRILLLLAFLPIAWVATPAQEPKLVLDREIVRMTCPAFTAEEKEFVGCPDDTGIVSVSAVGLIGNDIKYSVTGGDIHGGGKAIKWDVSKLQPGTYHITAETREVTVGSVITVLRCPCNMDCQCPNINIVGPPTARNGSTIDVSLPNPDYDPELVTFTWDVRGGRIVSGQNSGHILVKVSSSKSVTISVHTESKNYCVKVCPRDKQITIAVRR
jgi:hypothetical protein